VLAVLRAPLMTARARTAEPYRAALTAPSDSRLAHLSDRELQILGLVAQGRTNSSIARTLDVSPRTIAKHLEHIYRKLGVTSRAATVHRGPV